MSRPRNPEVVLLRHPVPVTVDLGALAPILVLGVLVAAITPKAGFPIATAAVLGMLGGAASLLAHEVGHVRAARKLTGLRPVGISLMWLGAATRLEGAYANGRDQARVAVAGPRMSFGVALGLIPVLLLPLPVGIKDLAATLIVVNVAIGALSLIPASPLDGYKLIVGLLWSGLGSEAAARLLLRRLAKAWIGLEALGTCVLLIERPLVGLFVVAVGLSLFGQKIFAHIRG